MEFPCRECGVNFSTRNNLKRHLSRFHEYTEDDWENLRKTEKESENQGTTYECETCEESFSSKRSLYRHNQQYHQITEKTVTLDIVCPTCSLHLKSHRLLVEHVVRDHYESNITMESKRFASISEFETWKYKKEEETLTRWVKRSVWNKNTIYYYCREEIRERYQETIVKKRSKETKQLCKDCTSHLIARISEDDSVDVDYCTAHYGHEPSVANAILSESDTMIILEKIQTLSNDEDILSEIHEQYQDSNMRMYFVDGDDLNNVRRKFANLLEPWKRDADDVTSVNILASSDEYGIVQFSPPTDSTGKGIRIIIITKEQMIWTDKYGRGTVVCDDTHCVSQYDIKLSTLLVLDNRDRGLPIAFMLTKNPNAEDWAELFKEVEKKTPSFFPITMMTDDSKIFYNGYSNAFPSRNINKRLCTWHVMRSLNRKCCSYRYDETVTDKISAMISVLLRTAVERRFRDRLRMFIDYIALNAPEFHEYFLKYYINRTDEWSAVGRVNEHANVSMAAEAFHAVLKDKYLSKGSMIRLDRLIFVLGQFVSRRSRRVDISDIRSKQRTYRQKQTNRRHFAMLNELTQLDVDFLDEFEFTVNSTVTAEQYSVMYTRNCTCETLNNNHCKNCQGCPYSWECECADSFKKGILCKHAHRVVYFIRENRLPFPHYEQSPETEGNTENVSEINDDDDLDVETLSVDIPLYSRHREPTEEDQIRLNRIKGKSRSSDMVRVLSSLQEQLLKNQSFDILEEMNDEVAKIIDKYGKDTTPSSSIIPRMDRKRKRETQRGKYTVQEKMPSNVEVDEYQLSHRSKNTEEMEGEETSGEKFHLKKRKKRRSRLRKMRADYPTTERDQSTTCTICNRTEPDEPSGSRDIFYWRKCSICRWWAHEICAAPFAFSCPCGGSLIEEDLAEDNQEMSEESDLPTHQRDQEMESESPSE